MALFLEDRRQKSNVSAGQMQKFHELIDAIKAYFDRALPLILLYHHERDQYERVKAEHKDGEFVPSDFYGAEHLLRLFVKLPGLLAQAAMTQHEVAQVE